MILEHFQRHKQVWLIALIVVIVPAFVLSMGGFGGLGGSSGVTTADTTIGYVDDIDITAGDLQRYLRQEIDQLERTRHANDTR